MHVIFQAHPARKTEVGFQVVFSMLGDNPRRTIEATSIADLRTQFDAYKAEIEATGKPYRVSLTQHPRDKSRKFPGFNKIEDYMTTATATATEADLEGVK